MSEPVISFTDIVKSYPAYHHYTGGIKNFLFNLRASLRAMHKRYVALDGLDLEIRKGENFGFIGRNGAGKSTILGLIAGVLKPDSGTIRVNGRVSPLLELGAGFHPDLTGRDNILLNGVLLGLTRNRVLDHLDRIIDYSELGEFIDHPVRTYSSGMYSKLGFSIVSILEPEILLLDEVLAVGDVAFVKKCERSFEQFRNDPDITMVLVSHTLPTVVSSCDRVAWIDDKKVRMVGPAEDVVKEYVSASSSRFSVDGTIDSRPQHLATKTPEVLCEPGAILSPSLHAEGGSERIRISLLPAPFEEPVRPDCRWLVQPGPYRLAHSDGKWTLKVHTPAGTEGETVPPVDAPSDACSETTPAQGRGFHLLELRAEKGEDILCPRVWQAVATDTASRLAMESHRGTVLATYGDNPGRYLPGWLKGRTVRIVARNIFMQDGVGSFVLGVGGLLTACGVSTSLYAHVTEPRLGGLVQAIGNLEGDLEQEDILFYNYSIEDEFLSHVASLDCAKLLFFQGVTPADTFREHSPEFADLLDRSVEQYHLFDRFDAALGNSQTTLRVMEPHLAAGIHKGHCPPTCHADRLFHTVPREVAMPDAARILLWVGRVVPSKRPVFALELFRHLAGLGNDVGLVMVGGGRTDFPLHAGQIDSALAGLPPAARDRAMLLEGVSDGELAHLYSNADLLLSTSTHEGFCLPLMEAMRFGLPVAATPEKAMEETLSGAGLILPDDPEQAATGIGRLLGDAKRLEDMKARGLVRAGQLAAESDGSAILTALRAALNHRRQRAGRTREG